MSRLTSLKNASLAALAVAIVVPALAFAQEQPTAEAAPQETASSTGNRADLRAQRMLERLDTNKDGVLDAGELAKGGREWGRDGGKRHGMRGHYGIREGRPAWGEHHRRSHRAHWRGPRPDMHARMIERLFDRADADNDGVVTREEIDALKSKIQERAERRENARYDHRQDRRNASRAAPVLEGGVTLEELAAAIEKLREERAR